MTIAKVAMLVGLLAVVGCQSDDDENETPGPNAFVSASDGGARVPAGPVTATCTGMCAESFETCFKSMDVVEQCSEAFQACKVACADAKCPDGPGCCGGDGQNPCPDPKLSRRSEPSDPPNRSAL